MDSIQIYLITAAIFLLGGAVKGTVGFGLPLVSITLLTPFYGLVDAIGLMVIPAVVTNFWQALAGGNFRDLLAPIVDTLCFWRSGYRNIGNHAAADSLPLADGFTGRCDHRLQH